MKCLSPEDIILAVVKGFSKGFWEVGPNCSIGSVGKEPFGGEHHSSDLRPLLPERGSHKEHSKVHDKHIFDPAEPEGKD